MKNRRRLRMLNRFVLLFGLSLAFIFFSEKSVAQGGYATMRVFDCNRSIGMGTGYISAKIFIVYEDGTTEEVELMPYTEKNEIENLKTINRTINELKSKGYFLITQYTTGEQGNLISDYTFLK